MLLNERSGVIVTYCVISKYQMKIINPDSRNQVLSFLQAFSQIFHLEVCAIVTVLDFVILLPSSDFSHPGLLQMHAHQSILLFTLAVYSVV